MSVQIPYITLAITAYFSIQYSVELVYYKKIDNLVQDNNDKGY
jgi:hypothetical protein